MGRSDYIRPSSQFPGELVLGASDWQRFDIAQWKSVNGDLGGVYTPSHPIVIGGNGGLLSSVSGTTATGGTRTQTGGRIMCGTSGGVPHLYPARSRTVRVSPMLLSVDPVASGGAQVQIVDSDAHGWGVRASKLGSGAFPSIYFEIPGRYLHSGARLASVSVDYVITQKPSVVPVGTPFALLVTAWSVTGTPIQLPGIPLVNEAAWTAGWTGFSAGEYTVSHFNPAPLYFRALNTGTTGGSEPVWPTTIGATVNDNGVVWEAVGRNGIRDLTGATTASYYNSGAPQSVAKDMDPAPTLAGVSSFWNDAQLLTVGVTYVDPTALITGIALSWDNITDMGFE